MLYKIAPSKVAESTATYKVLIRKVERTKQVLIFTNDASYKKYFYK